ncbi:MAG: hypothetical protein JSR37_00810 [Verrucomicrobia bacterium]|nr:hypothetical protein [Verrucomicrobiota bacterium]MBS0637297.1 hypothetical protein [Verrucomicrobiota bacterium]
MKHKSLFFASMVFCGLALAGNQAELRANNYRHANCKCSVKKNPLVGTWNYQFPVAPESDVIAYGNLIFFADGSLMGADSTGVGAFSGLPFNTFQTPLTGGWKCIGHGQYEIFFTNVVVNDQTREVIGRSRFDGIVTLSDDEQNFSLEFSSGVIYDKDNICLSDAPLFPIPSLPATGCKVSF